LRGRDPQGGRLGQGGGLRGRVLRDGRRGRRAPRVRWTDAGRV